ncbi:polyprenyl synthetase [Halostella sp. PRR32]|uniref:polyprenyl synthetase n=1 Tax=Halostella sp. PRR32 TaxID=3098147 RepID=UPI002B1E690F|nr:polyprenyl synthetase [Halostella sp. PRR32]
MTYERSLTELRAEIDSHLESVLKPADKDRLTAARETVDEYDDRKYGQLLMLSFESIATPASRDPGTVLPAATAVELLRGYCRLRSELLIQFDNGIAHSLTRDPMPALLSGDYLYTSAYSALSEINNAHLGACFETLTAVQESVIGALSTNYSSTPTAPDCRSFIDDTAGVLGEGAAVIGATLAGVDSTHRQHFATVGRGFGTGHQIQLTFGSGGGDVLSVFQGSEERELRQHAEKRLDEAEKSLCHLSSAYDTSFLRTFVEGTGSGSVHGVSD